MLSQGVRHEDVAEVVAADRDRDVGGDIERLYEQLVALLDIKAEPVAVLEFGLEARLRDPRFDLAGAGLDVVEAAAPPELSHGAHRRPRAVLRAGKGATEIVATQEPDLRIEVVADEQVVELEGVEVAVVGERRLVARVVTDQPGRLRTGVIAVDVDVVVEREGGVEPVDLVRAGSLRRDRPAGEDPADPAPAQNVSLDPEDREVGPQRLSVGRVLGLDVQRPDAEIACLAGEPSAPQYRYPRDPPRARCAG